MTVVRIVKPHGAIIPGELVSALRVRAELEGALRTPDAATVLLNFPASTKDPLGTVCGWLDDLRRGWRESGDYAVTLDQATP
jgi:hypothetical protein